MAIETLDDIIEEVADKRGVYGACGEYNDEPPHNENRCRVCFTAGLKTRIHRATEVEQLLTPIKPSDFNPIKFFGYNNRKAYSPWIQESE
jgi:hypothetical protein